MTGRPNAANIDQDCVVVIFSGDHQILWFQVSNQKCFRTGAVEGMKQS